MQKINLFIDGLLYQCSGIGRYYEFLIKELPKRDEINNIYTTINIHKKKNFEQETKNISKIKPIYVNYKFFTSIEFIFKRNILKNLESKVDIFHFPHINLPSYIPKNTVVTIYDLIPFTEFWDKKYLKKRIFKWYFERAIKKSKKIIIVSESTKKNIVNYYPKFNSKIKVIYGFVNKKFIGKSKKYCNERIIEGDYLLFIGNRKKHKNLSQLIIAFNSIKNSFPNLKLVIAGKKYTERDEVDLLREKLDLQNEMIEIISPNDKEIINLYKYAKAFVFPSLYEGFGLPPLEAMAIRTPVLVSNIPVLKEICGDAAYFINPYDPKNISEGIYKVLSDDNLRKLLIAKGKKRIKLFNPDKIIDQYIEMYKEVLDEKN